MRAVWAICCCRVNYCEPATSNTSAPRPVGCQSLPFLVTAGLLLAGPGPGAGGEPCHVESSGVVAGLLVGCKLPALIRLKKDSKMVLGSTRVLRVEELP